jgi:hypothetical protein
MEKEFESSVTGVGSAETQCERDSGECAGTGGRRAEVALDYSVMMGDGRWT